MQNTLKILITEDHELYRDGLRLLLQDVFQQEKVEILEAGDLTQAQAVLNSHPDLSLVFLDIHMPGSSGLDGITQIKARYPALPLVVVSTVDHQASIQQMLKLGADGFIAKTSSRAVMLQALKDVIGGEMVVIGGQDHTAPLSLSPRQLATLELLALGLPNKEIANQLNISPATVREYVSDLLCLFDCDNRTQTVLKARRLGFILD